MECLEKTERGRERERDSSNWIYRDSIEQRDTRKSNGALRKSSVRNSNRERGGGGEKKERN